MNARLSNPAAMVPSRHRAARQPLPPPYDALHGAVAAYIPDERLIVDPLRLLTWGGDASFYRLVPKIAVVVDSEEEIVRRLADCARLSTPVTFRAAGTSLSGQAITDSVLVLLGDNWRRCQIGADAATVTLQPGVIGADANRRLAAFGRKIGPDPASIDAAKIGGIAANNASGMCCGTAQNSYHTLAGVRVVLADGMVLDTRDTASRDAFVTGHGAFVRALDAIAAAHADSRACGANPPQVPDEEHDRLQPERARRFRGPARDPRASDDRLGRYTRVPQRDHLPYGPGAPRTRSSCALLFRALETACAAVTVLKRCPSPRSS